MVLKTYMWELNMLSWQCMEMYACIPAYAYTRNYKDFHVELCVSLLALKIVCTDASNLICYDMDIVTFSLCLSVTSHSSGKKPGFHHLSLNSVLVPFDHWYSSFSTISYHSPWGRTYRVHCVCTAYFAFGLQSPLISKVNLGQPILSHHQQWVFFIPF